MLKLCCKGVHQCSVAREKERGGLPNVAGEESTSVAGWVAAARVSFRLLPITPSRDNRVIVCLFNLFHFLCWVVLHGFHLY